jgi:hypothetical protein
MMKVTSLFLTSGAALMVAIASIGGLVWLAVAIPMTVATAAAYGLYTLARGGRHATHPERRRARSEKPHHRMAA